MALLPQEKAKQMLDMGLIRPDQFQLMYPEPPPEEPAIPQRQFDQPIGPEPSEDFIPKGPPSFLSNMGEAMGYNPDATMGDLVNVFGGQKGDAMRAESVKRDQEAYLPPLNQKPIPTLDDPYLAADKEIEGRESLLEQLANYPGKDSYDQIRAGMQTEADAVRQSAREQAAEYQRTMDNLEEINKDHKVKKIGQNARIEGHIRDMEAMRADLASTKIDSKRLFANASTGDKILASIGLILGGFGNINGGGNRAVSAIENAIERDVAEQKANYGIKREGMEAKESLYKTMLDKFKNEDAAAEATKLNLLKHAELKLAEIGARYQDKATQGKVQEKIGQLQLLQEQAQANWLNSLSGGDDPYKNIPESQAKRLVPGYGFAPDPSAAEVGRKAVALADTTISSINTILEKSKTAGRFDFGQNQEIDQLVKLLRAENKEAIVGSGAVTEGEREIIADIIKNPADFFVNREKARKALEHVRDAAARNRDVKLKSIGVRSRSNRFNSLKYEN